DVILRRQGRTQGFGLPADRGVGSLQVVCDGAVGHAHGRVGRKDDGARHGDQFQRSLGLRPQNHGSLSGLYASNRPRQRMDEMVTLLTIRTRGPTMIGASDKDVSMMGVARTPGFS